MKKLRGDLLRRAATDDVFDLLFPETIAAVSGRFWTTLAVATRVADLFREHGATHVLDVGSGPGKFCLAAGAAVPELALLGVEQRPHLVEAAQAAASRLRLPNVEFRLGDVATVDWPTFDGFYFFNPFGENLFVEDDHLDETVELSEERFLADVFLVERALMAARFGTTVITYHGFGGRMPRCYQLAHEEKCGTNRVRVWKKAGIGRPTDGYWLELPDGGISETSFFDPSLDLVNAPLRTLLQAMEREASKAARSRA